MCRLACLNPGIVSQFNLHIYVSNSLMVCILGRWGKEATSKRLHCDLGRPQKGSGPVNDVFASFEFICNLITGSWPGAQTSLTLLLVLSIWREFRHWCTNKDWLYNAFRAAWLSHLADIPITQNSYPWTISNFWK